MKTLYLIGGPMGVGKTAVCQYLKAHTDHCVFLDGDWCWDMHPFQVTAHTKAMVLDNIAHLLQNFLRCPELDTVYFCWVLHRQDILDNLLSRLDLTGCRVVPVSLLCTPEVLTARLMGDVRAGLRQEDVIARSLSYLPLYGQLKSHSVDTTGLTVTQAAEAIRAL